MTMEAVRRSLSTTSPLDSREYLFHFTGWHTGIRHILSNGRLRLSPLSATNDPWEFLPLVHVYSGLSESEWSDSLGLGPAISELRQRSLVACFCRDEKGNRAWRRSRMWAQYGERHEGLCFVFDRAILEARVQEVGSKSEWHSWRSESVRYLPLEDLHRDALDSTSLVGGALPKDPADHLARNAELQLFSKSGDFRDECEHRIALIPGTLATPKSVDVGFDTALVAVLLGNRFPREFQASLKESTRVPLLKVYWNSGYPSLDLV